MQVTESYSNLKERKVKVDKREAEGLRMLHDDFDPDWKRGDEPHGTLTFTDEPTPSVPLSRDPLAEIDELKVEVAKLKEKIK